MSTLVVHPKDRSTDFLERAYSGMYCNVLRSFLPETLLCSMMMQSDRLVFMGHGLPSGLIGFDKLYIDCRYVSLFRGRDIFCVWCNADLFMEKHNLTGVCTGMIISEMEEAADCGVNVTEDELLESNTLFAEALRVMVLQDEYDLSEFRSIYKGSSDVIKFNSDRVYIRKKGECLPGPETGGK